MLIPECYQPYVHDRERGVHGLDIGAGVVAPGEPTIMAAVSNRKYREL